MTDKELIATLKAVNFTINKETHYKTDQQLYKQEDFWTIMDQPKMVGDCEDYSLTKRQRLIELGIPASKLRLAVCYAENGEGHCVLTCDVDGVTYVLDNRFDKLKTYVELMRIGYKFLYRQAEQGYYWVDTTGKS